LVGSRLRSRRAVIIAVTTHFVVMVPGGAFFMFHWLNYVFRPVNSRVDQIVDYRLSTIDGDWVTSEDMKGKVVALNFWSTSCGACIEEFPSFDAFYRMHKDESDVVIYAVNIPLEGESREDIRRMVHENGYAFPILFTSSDIQIVKTQFGIQGIPTVLVLDGTGLVRYSGPFVTSKHDLVNQIDLRLRQAQQRVHDPDTRDR
jgi:thiol-disulfide isomerase/thioredoxin